MTKLLRKALQSQLRAGAAMQRTCRSQSRAISDQAAEALLTAIAQQQHSPVALVPYILCVYPGLLSHVLKAIPSIWMHAARQRVHDTHDGCALAYSMLPRRRT